MFQHDDFYGIFKAMDGLPVIIRLLDPPLHEFMPDHEQLAMRAAGLRIMGDRPNELTRIEELMKAVEGLREFNPMLGLRGSRLGIDAPRHHRDAGARAVPGSVPRQERRRRRSSRRSWSR